MSTVSLSNTSVDGSSVVGSYIIGSCWLVMYQDSLTTLVLVEGKWHRVRYRSTQDFVGQFGLFTLHNFILLPMEGQTLHIIRHMLNHCYFNLKCLNELGRTKRLFVNWFGKSILHGNSNYQM